MRQRVWQQKGPHRMQCTVALHDRTMMIEQTWVPLILKQISKNFDPGNTMLGTMLGLPCRMCQETGRRKGCDECRL